MARKIDESAVWQRVTAASQSAGEGAPSHQPVTPELKQLLSESTVRAAAYAALCRQTGNQTYRQLYQQEVQCRATLRGLYYYMTGETPPGSLVKTLHGTHQAMLRQLLTAEEQGAERFRALAEKAGGEVRETLLSLERQARRHWSILLRTLGLRL